MNTTMQTILASGSAKGTPMQRAKFGFLPDATNFYLGTITIEGKGEYIYTLNGQKVIVPLEDDFDGSIWVPAADAGSLLIVRGEAIVNIEQEEVQTLTSLDVSGLTALTNLNCVQNQLTSLDVSGLTALTDLNCVQNQLTSLDVSGLTALTNLYCQYNSLTSLDVSGFTALTTLYCSQNQLTSLDVSGCTALKNLYCQYNSLTSLDVSGLTALTNLNCQYNSLTSLDVSGFTDLTTLYCSNNSLTSLDVSGLTALTNLDCLFNSLITSIRFNATKQKPSNIVASLITNADSTTGTVYLNSSDAYYSTVANAATAKGWTILPL